MQTRDENASRRSPRRPRSESRRLAALRRYQVLDRPNSRSALRRIPRLAARLFDAPVAMLNFIDEEVLLVREAIGLETTDFDRDITFCNHTIREARSMVVPDATADPRFADNPLVTGLDGVRFYAGATIRTPDGFNIGTVAIVDHQPRFDFDDEDLQLLVDLADMAIDELELHRSQLRLRQVIDLIPHLVFAKDASGRYILANQAIAEAYGLSIDELEGKTDAELLPKPEQGKEFRADDLEVIESGEPKFIPHETLTDADGNRHDLETRKIPFELAETGEPAVLGVAVDITERVHLEKQVRNFFELPLDPMAIATQDGNFKRVNPAFVDTLGFSEEELLSKHYSELIHPDDLEETSRLIGRLQDGERITDFQNRLRCKDGSYRWLSWRIVPDTQTGLFYAVARDITKWKEAERIKDEFVSVVSHELRTPLTSVRGALDLALSDQLGEMPPKVGRMLELARDNTRRLGRLVDDILDIQKIEEGRIDFEIRPVDPLAVAREVVSTHRSYAERHDVSLQQQVGSVERAVEADADRLHQTLTNLISNAVKFSPPGESVRLAVDQPDSDHIRFEIQDHGPGIPEEFRDRVFDKFTQSDASDTRQSGGTGLGLSIARSLTRAMHGTIDFETEMGRGTTFRVVLPASSLSRRAVEAPAETEDPEEAAEADRWILHVEDDLDTAHILSQVVEEFARVVHTTTVTEAEAELREHTFDLIVVDLKMPDGSVDELLEARRRGPNAQTPIVVFSGREPTDLPRRLFDDVLLKGQLDIEELRGVLRSYLTDVDAT
jgi:PAS domain S-box-containing protein